MQTQTKEQTVKRTVFEIITGSITKQFEKEKIPWNESWNDNTIPKNLISGKPYRAVNIWLLKGLGYQSNYFLTFKQAQKLGAKVRTGEKGHPIAYWTREQSEGSKSNEKKKMPSLKHSFVFNIEQCENIPLDKIPLPSITKNYNLVSDCEGILWGMRTCPEIYHDREKPYYDRVFDCINIPTKDHFISDEVYYRLLFYLLVLSTGHHSRLSRKELSERPTAGSYNYSTEELIAEMGACYLCSQVDIKYESFASSGEYCIEWSKRFKENPKILLQASVQAQRAADFILNVGQLEKPIVHGETVSHEQAA